MAQELNPRISSLTIKVIESGDVDGVGVQLKQKHRQVDEC